MKRNLSKLLAAAFFLLSSMMISCFGVGDSIINWLVFGKIETWNDIVGVFNNNSDKNEYLILHKDTTFTHIYYINPENSIFSRGSVNFCLKSKGFSKIYFDNWEYYGNYINEVGEWLRPEEIVNNHTLRCGCVDDMEYNFYKVRNTVQYLKQFNCQIESAYSTDE